MKATCRIHLILMFCCVCLTRADLVAQDQPALRQFRSVTPAMGVRLSIVVWCQNPEQATVAIEAACRRVEQLEQSFSDYRADSEIVLLSQRANKNAVPVSDDLWDLLRKADAFSRSTHGAFDITLAPVNQLWRESRKSKTRPDPADVEAALKKVGYQKIQFHEKDRSVQLATDMKLDVGAIGKGFAADAALKELRQHGIDSAMVDLGGDIAVGEPPPGKTGWRIAIAPLEMKWKVDRYIDVSRCGIATSGDATQFVEIDGQRYSHILDPKTGMGIRRRASVTVWAPDAATADALASAYSVLNVDETKRNAGERDHVAVLIQERESGKMVEVRTTRFPAIHDLD